MQHNQAIFENLFGRSFSDPGNKAFLQQFVKEHPYFSPAQFFLLLQTNEGTEEYKNQLAKSNIFFNNPHWLHFQLHQTSQPLPSIELEEVDINDTDQTEDSDMETEIEPMKIELKLDLINTPINENMLFEPMHMVDYFASQGIKLTEEMIASDKLGKQLKSFTEWLKVMKKVHVENKNEEAGQSDTAIQTLAEKSNTEDEVITESMAEVFAYQGKFKKAAEVYEKLSLLNPTKSAYFATKLEQLKGS